VANAAGGAARFAAFGRDLELLTATSASILNFSRWASRPDPEREGRYLIEVTEARVAGPASRPTASRSG
jgi:hypothetical protein